VMVKKLSFVLRKKRKL